MASITLSHSLARLVRHPVEFLVRKWNWKSAIFSSAVRALIFFLANLSAGWHAAVGAMGAELIFRSTTSGFYGALTQNFREVQPAWQAAVTVMILLPLSSHSLELLVHWLRHTPNLFTSVISSMIFTAFSTLFNWYAMRNGALVVGAGSQSIGKDLRSMPWLICRFVAAPFIPLFKPARLNEPQDAASD